VVAEHGELIGHLAGAHDRQHAVAVFERVRTHRDAADRDPHDVAVLQDRGPHRVRHLLELLLPARRIGIGHPLLADHLVEHEVEQTVLAAHVPVEGGGAGVELLGKPPHAQALESLGVEQA
jgi:hypothetical protein